MKKIKEIFWGFILVLMFFALSGVESCPILILPIAILSALSMWNLRDVELEYDEY